MTGSGPDHAHDHAHAGAHDGAHGVEHAGEHAPQAHVRPYVLTGGRTSSSLGVFELHAPALALVTPEQLALGATPEERRIIELCQTPMSVAELAARLGTPVGVARVLVGDLVVAQMLQVRQAADRAEHRDVRLLERLLEGIRAL